MLMRHTSTRSHSFAAALLTMLALMAPAAMAEISQRAVNQAHDFLKTKEMGKEILSFVHFGAAYKGHDYLNTSTVVDGDGREVPDKFALVYRFHWEDDGVTDVAFLCNGSGRVYQVKMVKTNAVLQQPFALADMTIRVLSDVVISAMGDNLKEKDRAEVQRLVDAADSRGLLVAYLRLEQIFK
jgi:hypothetical protein